MVVAGLVFRWWPRRGRFLFLLRVRLALWCWAVWLGRVFCWGYASSSSRLGWRSRGAPLPNDRNVGVVMVLVGVVWLEAMHWWVLTPTYPGAVNRYWLIFWPTMLLALACAVRCGPGMGLVGEDRQREQRLMSMLVVFSGLFLLLARPFATVPMCRRVFLRVRCCSLPLTCLVCWSAPLPSRLFAGFGGLRIPAASAHGRSSNVHAGLRRYRSLPPPLRVGS